MIHVKIDLVPLGHEEGRKQINEFFIANTGKMSEGCVLYNIWNKDPRFPANPKEPDATTYHKRENGCRELVRLALDQLSLSKLI